MGIEMTISNLAISEARSPGEAQLLVAKHRFELEQAMAEASANAAKEQPQTIADQTAPPGTLYRALDAIEAKAAPFPGETGRLDKKA